MLHIIQLHLKHQNTSDGHLACRGDEQDKHKYCKAAAQSTKIKRSPSTTNMTEFFFYILFNFLSTVLKV